MEFSLLDLTGKGLVQHMNADWICHSVIRPAVAQHWMGHFDDQVIVSAIDRSRSVGNRQMQYLIFAFQNETFEAHFATRVVKAVGADQFCFARAAPELLV